MIKNVNEIVRVNKMTYIPRIRQANNFFNATPYSCMVRDLSHVYKLKYTGEPLSYSTYYALRRRI